jgi:hypothetical protein
VRDLELCRQLLGIESPGKVEVVDLSVPEQKVDLVVDPRPGSGVALPGMRNEPVGL